MHPEKVCSYRWREALNVANSQKRCGARTRVKTSCMSPAMKNGRCRMHGGQSKGAPPGEAHGRYIHGTYTIKSKEERRYFRVMCKEAMRYLDQFEF